MNNTIYTIRHLFCWYLLAQLNAICLYMSVCVLTLCYHYQSAVYFCCCFCHYNCYVVVNISSFLLSFNFFISSIFFFNQFVSNILNIVSINLWLCCIFISLSSVSYQWHSTTITSLGRQNNTRFWFGIHPFTCGFFCSSSVLNIYMKYIDVGVEICLTDCVTM